MVLSSGSKFSFCLAAILVVVSSAFAPNNNELSAQATTSRYFVSTTSLSASSSSDHDTANSMMVEGRRGFMQQLLMTTTCSASAAMLLLPVERANAGLLDDFGSDPGKINVVKKEEPIVPKGTAKKSSEIEPTLKGTYYYPTAKKRYLPRITKVTSSIAEVPQFIANGQWEEVEAFGKIADNCVLPLQLYVSSLDGQGLSMSNSYAKDMKKDAKIFEEQYKIFEKAVKKKDSDKALASVQAMAVAIVDYRQTGRLTDEMGNIPSVDEIKRSTMRRTTQAGFSLQQ